MNTIKREPFNLPLKPVPSNLVVEKNIARIYSLLKGQIGNIVNNKPVEFDSALIKVVSDIYNAGYDNGLSDMDKMHSAASEI